MPKKKDEPKKTIAELRKIAGEALKHGRTLARSNAQLLKRLEELNKFVAEHDAALAYRNRPRMN